MNSIKTIVLGTFLIFGFWCNSSNAKDLEKVNLGRAVNSECDEIIPIISANDSILYFTRGKCNGNLGGQDIWVSRRGNNGEWQKAENVGEPLNNDHNNFLISLTADGNKALVGNIYHENGRPEKGISITRKTTEGWSFPEPVEIIDYYNDHKQAGFFLANDAKTLLMTIQRTDTYGEKDIYVSFLLDDGRWSEPKNLGSTVNSEGEESTPYLAADGQTLYFSSNGHGGFGMSDIFISRRLDDSWSKWTEPENMGENVNTPNWDAYYKLTGSGEYAYFVSTENSYGLGDIFRMEVPKKLRPKPITLVSGRVINAKSLVPISADILFSKLPDGEVVGQAISDPLTGEYKMALPVGSQYIYKATSRGFFFESDLIDLKDSTEYGEITIDIELIPLSDSLVLLKNIFFETASYNLTPKSRQEVIYVSEFLQDNPRYDLEVYGHTDSKGSDQLNMSISQNRAKTAAKLIEDDGIPKSRIYVEGKGENDPVTTNETEEGRALNRRCEFYIRMRKE